MKLMRLFSGLLFFICACATTKPETPPIQEENVPLQMDIELINESPKKVRAQPQEIPDRPEEINFQDSPQPMIRFVKTRASKEVLQSYLPISVDGERPIKHSSITIQFDKKNRLAKWAAYSLTPKKLKTKAKPPKSEFTLDPYILESARSSDYNHSGYEKGLLVPFQDMAWSTVAMKESHFMSNVVPMDAKLKMGLWQSLEKKIRSWSMKYEETYVAAGPLFRKPCLKKIAKSVCVPAEFFKVVCMKKGDKYKTIGFIFRQRPVKRDLSDFAVTVDSVEKASSIDFFPGLAASEAKFIFE